MPEINDTSNIIKLRELDPQQAKKLKEKHGHEPALETQVEIDLEKDPKGVTGRSLVHSTKSKEAKALKKRVDAYAKEFMKDREKAVFLMDSVDKFVEEGFSLEDATEATIKLSRKIGEKRIDAIKDVPGIGQSAAELCTALIKKFNWDLEKSIDVAAKTFNIATSQKQ